MKRIMFAVLIGLAMFSIVAYAATLSFSGGGTAAAGNVGVASCGTVALTWGQSGGLVYQVHVDATTGCAGKTAAVFARDALDNNLGSGGCVLSAGGICDITFGSPFTAGPLDHAYVVITDY